MARKQATKTEDTSSALALVDEAAALAELSEFFDDVGVDGLEDVGGEDVKLAVVLWNMKGLDKSGKSYPRDVFFNTNTEETQDTVECVLLTSTKTKRYDSFDNALDKTVVHCESRDRIHGTTADGTRRPCKGCPDDGWFTNEETGKPMRKCGEVHNVVAIERLTQKPFVVRFKKTGLAPFRKHVMAHHWGGRGKTDPETGKTKRANVPLFCYAVTLSLKMHESGKYALPILDRIQQGTDERGEPTYLMPVPDVRAYGGHARDYVDMMGEVLAAADAQAERHTSSERDDGLSSSDFADG